MLVAADQPEPVLPQCQRRADTASRKTEWILCCTDICHIGGIAALACPEQQILIIHAPGNPSAIHSRRIDIIPHAACPIVAFADFDGVPCVLAAAVLPTHQRAFQPGFPCDGPERGGKAEAVGPLVHQRLIRRVTLLRVDDRVGQPAVNARGLFHIGHAAPDTRGSRSIQRIFVFAVIFCIPQPDDDRGAF